MQSKHLFKTTERASAYILKNGNYKTCWFILQKKKKKPIYINFNLFCCKISLIENIFKYLVCPKMRKKITHHNPLATTISIWATHSPTQCPPNSPPPNQLKPWLDQFTTQITKSMQPQEIHGPSNQINFFSY